MVVSVGLVQRHHIRSWADQADSRYGLAELMLRLVKETAGGEVDAQFALDEGADIDGFDGTAQADVGSRWVPDGRSAWEISTEQNVGTKASRDYNNRVTAPEGWNTAETVYVAVSLRAWRRRDRWAAARTAKPRWREVRALGLDDIVSWLRAAPKAEFWLARRLKLHPEEFEIGPRWWEGRQHGTGGLFDTAVALAGRRSAVEDLEKHIADGRGPIVVEAPAIEEALDFIAAAGEASGTPGGGCLLDRMVFVGGANAWQRLVSEEVPRMVLVATDPELTRGLGQVEHTVVVPVQARGGAFVARSTRDGTRDCVVVPRLDSRAVTEALNCAAARGRGIDLHRAQILGSVARRSASALRRELLEDPMISVPDWARTDTGTSLTARQAKMAALLAGQWMRGSSEHPAVLDDRQALIRLAGGSVDYEAIEFELNGLATGPDPMVVESGSTWRLVNPNEAWRFLAGHLLTADAIHQFLMVAAEALSERNPLDDLTGDAHFLAQLRGVGRRHSRALRRGVARTLALMCTHGSGVPLPGGRDSGDLARRCVRGLFDTAAGDPDPSSAARVRRLVELGEVLPMLAEAAPDEFVAAIERTLQPASEAEGLWFTDARDDLSVAGASSPHTPLLFSLEMLAWLPDHLADVANILLQLEVLDPGGRLANRPAATFSAIFSSWAPQTGVGPQQRLEVLRRLHDRVRASGDSGRMAALVRLLTALLPPHGSTVMSSTPPQIRDYQSPPDSTTGRVVYDYEENVRELLVGLTEHRVRDHRDPDAMLEVLEAPGGVTTATSLPPAARDRLWTLFEEAASEFTPEDLAAVCERLEGLVRLHRQYANAAWALPADEADRVARIAAQITADLGIPDDLVERHLWLFDRYHPDLGHEAPRVDDLAAYEQRLRVVRAAAVSEVMRSEGLNGVYRLAARAEADGQGAAPVGVIGEALEELESRPPDDTDNGEQHPRPSDVETRLLAALDLAVDAASYSQSAQREAVIARGYFAARFRRIRRITGDGWRWLRGLLHSEDVTAAQQARLIELTREHPQAWRQAEALGPAPLKEYWKLMTWYGLGHDFDHLEDVALGLLSVGRAADAVGLLSAYRDDVLSPDRRAELAIDALEALVAEASTAAAPTAGAFDEGWSIEQLLGYLAQHHPLTGDNLDEPLLRRLTQLDIDHVSVRDLDQPAPFIHNRMSLDPHTFVDIVRLARPEGDSYPPDPGSGRDTSPVQQPRWRMSRSTARRILDSWQRPPGIDDTGALDPQRMRAWIAEAQRLLDNHGLRDVGDRHIGRVLSAVPADPTDGIAPPIALRDLLEEGQSQQFEDGLGSGLLFGPSGGRGGFVSELIAESRRSEQRTERDAATIAAHWPKTARLLRQVARGHAEEARSWEDDPDPLD